MQIETITTYRLDGKIFTRLDLAKEHVENEIGKIIDACPVKMTGAQALAVFDAITKNRKRLCDLLDVTVTLDNGDQLTEINILDFKD